MLNWSCIQVFADPIQNVLARVAVVAHDAQLDEFVGGEAAVYFTGHRERKAAAADQHGGLEGMGAGFERPAFARQELQRHGILLKRAF